MNLNFTQIALSVIGIFVLLGWLRGPRRAAITSGSIFFSMVLVSLMGADLVRVVKSSGLKFHPPQQSDLFLAIFFVVTVYVVRLGASRIIDGSQGGQVTGRQRWSGALLGLLNGFLLVANFIRYANPYLNSVASATTGGWTWHIPLPQISQAHGSSITFAIQSVAVTVTPSPLLNIYNTIPTALILLFAFLIFVFVGTLYGRVIRPRD
ncbi:MAG: hypothetical protein JWO42_2530 [Chloroflexi bacterium]|jgi:uncharacterized membrane protein required for colicin V production|nr:hypothetical protein [Chloroflexota bacterium]